MFETFKSYENLMPLMILLGFFSVVMGVGLWYVKKTTGRPLRDMLALFCAGITLTLLMMLAVAFFHDRLNLRGGRAAFTAVFLIVAMTVAWVFNQLAKRHSSRKKRERENNHLIGKSNSPDSH